MKKRSKQSTAERKKKFIVINQQPPNGAGICDFCSAALVVWKYPANDFIGFDGVRANGDYEVHESVGPWAACDVCKKMVDAGDLEGLRVRSVMTAKAGGIELNEADEQYMDDLHRLFFANRTGDGCPV